MDPEFLEAQIALAQLDMQLGKYDEAREIASKLQKKQPSSAAGAVIAGDVWMAQKKYDRAIKSFEDALALEKSGDLVSKLHQAMAQAGRNKDAEALMRNWLTEHKEDRVSRLYLAGTYRSGGDSKRAEDLYQDVLRLDPNNVVALNELALIFAARKDPRALDIAERAYKLRPTSDSVGDTLGWILVESGNPGRGQQLLEKVVSSSPSNAEAHYHLAVALLRLGNKTRGRAELTQALTSSNTFPQTEEAKKLLNEL